MERFRPIPDVDVLNMMYPIPGYGILPINAFVLHGAEPILVDTGVTLDPEGASNVERFMAALGEAIDPGNLRWVWLTHTDQDHVGALSAVLQAAPRARLVTSFMGMGKMGLFNPLPMDRVHLLNPGQSLQAGERTLTAFRPPNFDAPETTGFFERSSGLLFSSDCFGGLLLSPHSDAREIPADELLQGTTLWATADSPWLHRVDASLFERDLAAIRAFAPQAIFSSHLPPAVDMDEQLLSNLAAARDAPPFVGPDQAALEAMLGEVTGTAPAVPT
jgi:flavorubredoxin